MVKTLPSNAGGTDLIPGRELRSTCLMWIHMALFDPMDCSLPASSLYGDSPGKNTGVGCRTLLEGIVPTQGLSPGLPHCRQILYQLSYQVGPTNLIRTLKVVHIKKNLLKNIAKTDCDASLFITHESLFLSHLKLHSLSDLWGLIWPKKPIFLTSSAITLLLGSACWPPAFGHTSDVLGVFWLLLFILELILNIMLFL